MSEPTTVAYTGTRRPDVDIPGLDVAHVPALRVEPVPNFEEDVRNAIRTGCALVFYSRNAVRIVADSGLAEDLEPADRFDWWAVGPKTAEALRTRLGVDVQWPDTSNFEGLASCMQSAELPEKVVALSLEGTERDLGAALAESAVRGRDVPVYRTVPHPAGRLADELADADPEWIAVASRKGLESIDRAVAALDRRQPLRWAAIGPKTAEAIREAGREVAATADRPGVKALLRAVSDEAHPS